MKDHYGRQISYLRISVTDRCNLRCRYCMPVEQRGFVPSEDQLTPLEIEQLAQAAVSLGFDKLRLTGGEPTLRRDIVEIVERLAGVPGVDELLMTTNGIRLPWLADPLAQAGLRRVNIHVDSLEEVHLARLTRFNVVHKVWAGVEAAERAGLRPVKLNAVVVRDYNEEDVVGMTRLTLEREWHVRFIELMPLGEPAGFALDHFVPTQESMDRIERALGPLLPLNDGKLQGEAQLYRLDGGRGSVGFISPVSHPYCDSCNHLRVTADGRIRLCLLSEEELSVRDVLRGGGSIQDLAALLRRAVACKPPGSQLEQGVFPANRAMVRIGG